VHGMTPSLLSKFCESHQKLKHLSLSLPVWQSGSGAPASEIKDETKQQVCLPIKLPRLARLTLGVPNEVLHLNDIRFIVQHCPLLSLPSQNPDICSSAAIYELGVDRKDVKELSPTHFHFPESIRVGIKLHSNKHHGLQSILNFCSQGPVTAGQYPEDVQIRMVFDALKHDPDEPPPQPAPQAPTEQVAGPAPGASGPVAMETSSFGVTRHSTAPSTAEQHLFMARQTADEPGDEPEAFLNLDVGQSDDKLVPAFTDLLVQQAMLDIVNTPASTHFNNPNTVYTHAVHSEAHKLVAALEEGHAYRFGSSAVLKLQNPSSASVNKEQTAKRELIIQLDQHNKQQEPDMEVLQTLANRLCEGVQEPPQVRVIV